MGPFYKMGFFSEQTGFVIALLIGVSFGFWLERAGFGHSRKLAMQFYFRDMTVLKVMFTAIVVAMIGLLYLGLFGWIDLSLIYINPTFLWAQLVGGLILGIGFAIGGYCPGTSLVGAVTGRIDGIVFIVGAMFGMFVFGEIFPFVEKLFYAGAMGKETLPGFFGISSGIVAFVIILMAVGMFIGGEFLEKKFGKEEV